VLSRRDLIGEMPFGNVVEELEVSGAVLLQAAQEGVQAQPLGQATDLPGSRQRLGHALGLVGTPQLALRLGYATGSAGTPRRDIDDVLTGSDPDSAGLP
jgi:hypothetical protein